jgi:hypothetical protein
MNAKHCSLVVAIVLHVFGHFCSTAKSAQKIGILISVFVATLGNIAGVT